MLTEYWVAADETGRLGLFSADSALPAQPNLVRGTEVLEVVRDLAATRLSRLHSVKPLSQGGMFLPAIFIAKAASSLRGLKSVEVNGAGFYAFVEDDSQHKEQIEECFIDDAVSCFEVRPKLSPEIAALAGFAVFEPDVRLATGHTQWRPDDTLKPQYIDALSRAAPAPATKAILADDVGKRIPMMQGVTFSKVEGLEVASYLDVVKKRVSPTGLLEENDTPSSPLRWAVPAALAAGAAAIIYLLSS